MTKHEMHKTPDGKMMPDAEMKRMMREEKAKKAKKAKKGRWNK